MECKNGAFTRPIQESDPHSMVDVLRAWRFRHNNARNYAANLTPIYPLYIRYYEGWYNKERNMRHRIYLPR